MLGPGVSSESIWTPFASMSTANVRVIRARFLVAWTKQQTDAAFAIIGSSIIGGTDLVKGSSDSVINQADLYSYFDETERVMRLEYERHLIEPLGGAAIAMADVLLDNTDLRFTPNFDSTIGTALKPNRPLKIFIGFEVEGQEKTIQIIEGLSLQPQEDKINRTVKLSAYDFTKFLDGKPQETAIYIDKRSDEIIADILSRAGLGSSNYMLDRGLNTVSFAWFEKGQTAGERIKRICEAEEAIFYQDEEGIFRFENRNKYSQAPYNAAVWTIEPDDIIEWIQQGSSQIINRAIVAGKPRSLKGEVEIWRDGVEEEVLQSSSKEIWAEFEDPVSSITAPESLIDYAVFDHADGAGSDMTSDVTVTVESFTKSAKITLTNNSATKFAHFYYLKLRGTPATVDYEISEVYQDDNSIDVYNEHQEQVDNEFIDRAGFAGEMARHIVQRNKDPLGVLQLKIRGVPQLQLRDQIRVKDLDLDTYTNYRLIGIQGVLEPGSFVQTLTLREITSNESL